MIPRGKSLSLSSIIGWNSLVMACVLIVLAAIQTHFLSHAIYDFSNTTLKQHLTSQEATLKRAVASMSKDLARDVAQGLLDTGYFDRIEIIDDFGDVMNLSSRHIESTTLSKLAEVVFSLNQTVEIIKPITTAWGGQGRLIVRANFTRLTDSLISEIFFRSFLIGVISLLVTIAGTTIVVAKIHKGANALAELASDIASNENKAPETPRNFHFLEFEYLAQHLRNSIKQLTGAYAALTKANDERAKTEDAYQLTLHSLKLYSRFFGTKNEVLYSNFEGMGVEAFEVAFAIRRPALRDYLNVLKTFSCDCEILTQRSDVTDTVVEQMNLRIVENENSWFVQMSMLNDGRVLLTCSDISDVRTSDRRRFHREKMESLGRIASNVAHEFNNMLHIMLSSIEIAKERGTTVDVEQLYDTALVAGQRATGVVKRLQQLSRNQDLSLETLDVNGWLESSKMLMQAVVGPSIEIEYQCDDKIAIVADASALDAALINLCKNSADAITGSGKISIEVQYFSWNVHNTPDLDPDKQYVSIKFRDSGPGILRTLEPKIFDPYFTTKEKYMGTGLGLSEVKTMIAEMNGDIQLDTSVEVGAAFIIYLESAPPIESEKVSLPAAHQPEALYDMTILIVEDEVLLSQLMTEFLCLLGMDVYSCATVQEAKTHLMDFDRKIDVAILDNTLPDGFGVDLLPEIKNKHPNCHCISISGEPGFDGHGQFDDHATKPLTLAQLKALILAA